ncbi:hypothetical protein QCE62_00230 [Caballeronia sp. LZ033]|uniref:hypothetical protein n=1 Tax=Caballeronia sp. LZ033 TaxID=3038566 RepID=UPI0028550FF9|nr:hypothetical protein [Caballeronia sp. LZ033]MDR5812014.1 hypothetical protein [Caballeronia sp. LZ033]
MIFLPAKPHHIKTLAANLRPEDRAELAAAYGRDHDLSALLMGGLDGDQCEVMLSDAGLVLGVWGYGPLSEADPSFGFIWMLATPALQREAISFLRACEPSIDKAHDRYTTLVATPWRGNPLHIKWLEWCGFALTNDTDAQFPVYTHVRTSSDSGGDVRSVRCRGGDAVLAVEQGDQDAS